jgi:hypothetical protein
VTSIYEITADIQELEELLAREEQAEESDQERIARLSAFLTHKERLLADKVDAYVKVYRDLEAVADARREEAKHLAELARYAENDMERLKQAVRFVAQHLDQSKLEGKTRSITVSASKRPALDILSEEDIPTEFKEQIVSWRIDKKAITEHIVATGEIPPGVETRPVITVTFR